MPGQPPGPLPVRFFGLGQGRGGPPPREEELGPGVGLGRRKDAPPVAAAQDHARLEEHEKVLAARRPRPGVSQGRVPGPSAAELRRARREQRRERGAAEEEEGPAGRGGG